MKYYFELELENKNTNYTRCDSFSAIGTTLDDARRNLIFKLEDSTYDNTAYTAKLEDEFIRINNISNEQLEVLKAYFELEQEEIFDFWTINDNYNFIEKVLNKKLKNIDVKTQLEIAIDEIAPGYYHNLRVIRHY